MGRNKRGGEGGIGMERDGMGRDVIRQSATGLVGVGVRRCARFM